MIFVKNVLQNKKFKSSSFIWDLVCWNRLITSWNNRLRVNLRDASQETRRFAFFLAFGKKLPDQQNSSSGSLWHHSWYAGKLLFNSVQNFWRYDEKYIFEVSENTHFTITFSNFFQKLTNLPTWNFLWSFCIP